MSKLSGREFRIILFIMRQTNGYLREEDQISPAFFERMTGISRTNVPHVLAKLKRLRIIAFTPGTPPTYSVNPPHHWDSSIFVKNYEVFRQIQRADSSKMTRRFVKNDEKQIHPKENLKTTNYRGTSSINNMVIHTPADLKRIKQIKEGV